MLSTLIITLLAGTPRASAQAAAQAEAQALSLPSRLALVTVVERLPLLGISKGGVDLVVEPIQKRIELRGIANSRVVAQKMALAAGQLCPEIWGTDNAIVFQCRTRRLEARLVTEQGKNYLEIQEVRGVPWNSSAIAIPVFYDPETFEMGDVCPGSTFAGRGECAVRDGRERDAVKHFQHAIEAGQMLSLAGLRLGDIALHNGDVVTALAWYRQVSYSGDTFGRVAAARLCELDGTCLNRNFEKSFKPQERPEPVRTELLLRGARAAVYGEEFGVAVKLIAQAMESAEVGPCDTLGLDLCHRLVLACLENTKSEDAALAIETFLNLPVRQTGPMAAQLVRAAAERAAAIGAPLFAGNLMAANAGLVDAANYPDHLLRMAEFFLDAGDVTRAGIVMDYADTRVARLVLNMPRWLSVRNRARGLEGATPSSAFSAFELLATEGARDLAAAYGALSRARTVKR